MIVIILDDGCTYSELRGCTIANMPDDWEDPADHEIKSLAESTRAVEITDILGVEETVQLLEAE